ncbi:MAG3720 family protein [Mycoplasmopsis cricetuli]|uniref:MAG3720 family protein n=1 Tax=Mycoplasmopsis cricetuli TaxID=171283 RepID=UPI00046FD9D0|nr:hypothetical protein [Mycoplasmopsis cricetuli]
MNELFANFYIQRNQIIFSPIEKINGNYLLSQKLNKKVIMPNNIFDFAEFIENTKNNLSNLHNFKININLIIDDSEIENIAHNLIKTTIYGNQIENFNNLENDIEKIVSNKISNHLKQNNAILVGSKINYEYLLYKNNSQVKVYNAFPKGKKFEKLIIKTSYFYQFATFKYNDILSVFKALPNENINCILKSQITASFLKNQNLVNFAFDVNKHFISMALVYNGVIINYQKIMVGTINLIFKIAKTLQISFKNAQNKLKYVLINFAENKFIEDENLKKIFEIVNLFVLQIQQLAIKLINQKFLPKEKLNILSFSGELDWMNNFLAKKTSIKENLGFASLANSNNLIPKNLDTNNTIIEGAMVFVNKYLSQPSNPVNTVSSYYNLKQVKKHKISFRDLFAFKKFI